MGEGVMISLNNVLNEQSIAQMEKSLRYISTIVKQKGREILNDYTITPPQFVALQWLLEYGDMTIGDLSNKMFSACSTTTDLVDRMERNHLVMRVKDVSDRRVVRIHLLEEGTRIIEEVVQKRQDYLKSILDKMSPDATANLQNGLEKLYIEMKEE